MVKTMGHVVEIDGVRIINLTPHEVRLVSDAHQTILVWGKPPEGVSIPRVREEIVEAPPIGGIIPIRNKRFLEPENLPPQEENTYYIVSSLVAQATRRHDLLVPNTVRDERGQIVGASSFAQIL